MITVARGCCDGSHSANTQLSAWPQRLFGRPVAVPLQRPGEHPSQYFAAVCLEAAAMGEGDPLWLPRKDRADSGPRFSSLQEHRQAHAEEDLATWIVHSGHPGRKPPGLGQLVQLKIEYRIGKHERL